MVFGRRPPAVSPPGSRSSIKSFPQMPVISEEQQRRRRQEEEEYDEEMEEKDTVLTSGTTTPSGSRVPPIPPPRRHSATGVPLRVPQKSYRRSMARAMGGSHPPPYVNASYTPPKYNEAELLERTRQLDAGQKEFEGHRRSWWRFLLLVGVLMAVIAGLAVGLTVGLRKKNHSGDSSGTSSDDSDDSDAVFPAGSFTFNTTLQKTSTSCTSNPTTWRCYPYENDGAAAFFWFIVGNPRGSEYAVSSTDNPFAPSFSNVTMSTIDAGETSERLIFSFKSDRTIVPSDALTPTNRAAKCTFKDTRLEAILWTRRRDGKELDEDDRENLGTHGGDHSSFADWPGDVQIRQVKEAELGEPVCEDSNGNEIADVQAGGGDCECRYGNFDVDD